jgi:hypothetical protein
MGTIVIFSFYRTFAKLSIYIQKNSPSVTKIACFACRHQCKQKEKYLTSSIIKHVCLLTFYKKTRIINKQNLPSCLCLCKVRNIINLPRLPNFSSPPEADRRWRSRWCTKYSSYYQNKKSLGFKLLK